MVQGRVPKGKEHPDRACSLDLASPWVNLWRGNIQESWEVLESSRCIADLVAQHGCSKCFQSVRLATRKRL